MALTPKQQAFVREYVVDCNATQAATRAGYSAATANEQGSRLLANVSIQAAVAEAFGEIQRRTLVAADKVITGLLAEAERMGEGSSHSARVAAWVALGKHLGLFVDRMRHEGGVALEVTEEIIDAGDAGAKGEGRQAARRSTGVPPK